MFRVSKVDERSRTVITIDGQLSGDYIEAVKTCCDQAISTGKPVHHSLSDVSTIDQGGSAWNPMVSDVHHTEVR
jgi:hypothetical protein